MKRKLIKQILTIALVFVMMLGMVPDTVFASETRYLYVGELKLYDQYTVDGETAIDGTPDESVNSYIHWNWETRTLTMKNFTQTITAGQNVGETCGISYEGRVNLVLIGNNTITVESTKTDAHGFYCHKDLTITGAGSLSITSPAYAIGSNGNITANCSGKIYAKASSWYGMNTPKVLDILQGTFEIHGIRSGIKAGTLNITNAVVEAYAAEEPIATSRDITIKSSTVKAICNNPTYRTSYDGIGTESNGSINIEDSQVEAVGSKGGSVAGNGIRAGVDINITNSTVSAIAGTGMLYDIYNNGKCVITDSTIDVTSNGTDTDSRGFRESSPSISNSTVTVTSSKAAFNSVPSVDVNKCAVWYGSDSTAAAASGIKSASELSANYGQKYVRIEPYDHTHNWKYSASGDTITVSCDAANCLNANGGSATLKATDRNYNGGYIQSASMEYSDGWLAEKVNDDTITYTNNLNVGIATAKVMIGGYELTTTFEIKPEDISNATVTLVPESETYTGNAYAPSVAVTYNGTPLVENTDYTISWDKTGFKNADSYMVSVAGIGNFTGSVDKTFKINAADLNDVSVVQVGTLIYDGGEPLTPSVSVNALAVNDQPISFAYSLVADGTYGSMPSFTDVGTYTVYYKATAANHKEATGSFSVKVDKATVAEPTITSKAYNGSVQIADINDTELYTVAKNEGGTTVGGYDVVLKLKDADNYEWATSEEEEVTLQFNIIAAENIWTTVPSISGWTYGKTANAPICEAKFGTVDVSYAGTANDGSDYDSNVPPTKAGKYIATFTVNATENYAGLSKQVEFTIAKADYNMSGAKWDYSEAFHYDGYGKTVKVIGLPDGVTVKEYTGNVAAEVGDYAASVTFNYDSANYNEPVMSNLSWSIINTWTPVEYTATELNANGWTNVPFELIANDSYKIATDNKNESDWTSKLTYSAETDNGEVTFYLRRSTGEISLPKTVNYKLDMTSPTGKVEFVERTGWETFVSSISFGLFYKDEVTVKVTANDNLSGIAKTEYAFSDKAMTLDEVKAMTNWSEYNGEFGVALEDAKKFVYFIRITDKAGNVTYISTDGAEYDTTAPVVTGIENSKTYYTTQKVSVTDTNLEAVTVNGTPVFDPSDFSLVGNTDVEFVVSATDKAGNSTIVTVTMKPVSDLSKPIDHLTKDDVNSGNEQAVDSVKAAVAAVDTTNATDEEKAVLKEITDKVSELESVIDETKAEIDRINEEMNKYNKDTVNSDDAAALEQLSKDIQDLLDGGNLTDAERTALTDDADNIAEMQKTVADTVAENERISDEVDNYDITTVTSEDKADLEKLLDDIEKQLESKNLTEEEISELNGDKKAVEDLLAKIKGTDELIEKIIDDMDGYSEDAVKSTDQDAIEQLIEDIDTLLETENLTENEKKALEDAKEKAEDLLDIIEDAAKAPTTENTEKVKDITPENVKPENKTDLEKAKADLEKVLEEYAGNYTEEEKKAIEDDIKRIDEALKVISKVEKVEELIDKLPDKIKKEDEAAIKAAEDAYNALSDYEKSLVDENVKKSLNNAKAALAELNKATKPNASQTGDNSNLWLWFTLLLAGGAGVFGITLYDRKRKMNIH